MNLSSTNSSMLRDTAVYTELNGLNNIRLLGQEDRPEALRQIAIQFESIFLNMMLKEMRKGEDTLFADNMLRTDEMAFHRENLDNQLSLHLASEGGVGLADALYRQLLEHYQPESALASVTAHSGAAAYRSIAGVGQLSGAVPAAQVQHHEVISSEGRGEGS